MPERQDPLRPRPPAPADDWALFLDVDGCLLDFAPMPDRVEVPLGLRECLLAWSERLHGALALVSGRSLAAVDALFWPLKLPAAGLHGLELRSAEGLVCAPATGEEVRRLRIEAERLAARHPGALVENKGAGFALHWRAAPEAAAALCAFAEVAVERLPGFRLQPGNQVVELRPEGPDKGDAIARLLAQPPFAGRVPVFVGDDLTDEHGFTVINARGGFSVLVGSRAGSAARYALRDPADVRAWLCAGLSAEAAA